MKPSEPNETLPGTSVPQATGTRPRIVTYAIIGAVVLIVVALVVKTFS